MFEINCYSAGRSTLLWVDNSDCHFGLLLLLLPLLLPQLPLWLPFGSRQFLFELYHLNFLTMTLTLGVPFL